MTEALLPHSSDINKAETVAWAKSPLRFDINLIAKFNFFTINSLIHFCWFAKICVIVILFSNKYTCLTHKLEAISNKIIGVQQRLLRLTTELFIGS